MTEDQEITKINEHEIDLEPGTYVDHFRIMRLLGEGGMAQVYLARDSKLGRKVALKVIKPAVLGTSDAVARFLFEARATARFNHPHIVTIHAVGEHLGRPYVALEYLEGQTLRERMEDSRPSVAESIRLGLAIAEALAEAHENQILHRDLKPENVVIHRDGQLRVVDFGLAKTIVEPQSDEERDTLPPGVPLDETALSETQDMYQSEGAALRGTPFYMAPEQWRGAPCAGATDIWALGVILHELLTGRRPYEAPSAISLAVKVCHAEPVPELGSYMEIHEDVSRLIGRCLAKEPVERPPAEEIVETLSGRLLHRRPRISAEESPFRGLMPFGERHAGYFYGRDTEIRGFLERLRDEPILPVVGPSGAGKSSFIQAGIIPRLREQGKWTVLRLRPGAHPLKTLASKLRSGETSTRDLTQPSLSTMAEDRSGAPLDPSEDEKLAKELLESPNQLNLLLHRLAESTSSRILLFVDQLEELYALVPDESERRAFLRAICTAADDHLEPVRVVFTLREDFIGRLAEGPEVRDALSHLMVLRSPDSTALEEILTRPLATVGYRYDDPSLVKEMVRDVGGEPACLPLLQFVTRTLWDRRDRKRHVLKRDVYDEVGGVGGALAFHADGVLEGMSEEGAGLARELLLELVTPEGTRRSLSRREILSQHSEGAEEVLDRLTQARLISVRRVSGSKGGGIRLELAHESLIHSWKRLARWIDESQEDLTFLEDVNQAAELWVRRGQRQDELWTGDALKEAQRNFERCARLPGEKALEFLSASQEMEQRRLRRKRLRGAIWSAALILSTAGALLVAAEFAEQKRHAVDQREQAVESWSEAEREAARNALFREELLEARARVRGSLQLMDTTLSRALWWRLQREPLRWKRQLASAAYDVSFSPDGRQVAVAGQDEVVHLFDSVTLAVRELRGHEDQIFCVAFSPDGKRLASGTWTGEIRVWDLATGSHGTLDGHKGQVWRLAFSPDGELLASASHDRTIRLWDTKAMRPLEVLTAHEGPVGGLVFGAEGKVLISASYDRTVRQWRAPWTSESTVIASVTANDIALGSKGRLLALGGSDRVLRLLDLSTNEVVQAIRGQHADLLSVDISPDGHFVASGGGDGSVRIWQTKTGELWSTLPGHEKGIHGLDFSPDGKHLASASFDGSISVWDASKRRRRPSPPGHRGAVSIAVIGSQDRIVASGGEDKTIRLWDSLRGTVSRVLRGHSDGVSTIAFSPSGQTLASGSHDKTIRVWDAFNWRQKQVLTGHYGVVNGLAFGRDGRILYTAAYDMTIKAWDLADGSRLGIFMGHEHGVQDLAISGDGQTLASGSIDKTIRIWDAEAREQRSVLRGHEAGVWGVAFGPEGSSSLVSSGEDRTLRLWDLERGTHKVLGEHPGRVYHVAYHPNGREIATAGSDGTARLWDLETGESAPLIGHRSEVNSVEYSRDGDLLVTASDDGTVRLWSSDTRRPYWRAPLLLTSPDAAPSLLSHRGWESLEHSDASRGQEKRPWRRAIEDRAYLADAELRTGGVVCVVDHEGNFEIWDNESTSPRNTTKLDAARRVWALPVGCVAHSDRGVTLLGFAGQPTEIHGKASAVAVDRDAILVATDDTVGVFGYNGRLRETHRVSTGVRAILRTREGLVLGFSNGGIELWARDPDEGSKRVSLERTPSSEVVGLKLGPMSTLIAGFASGHVGLWDLKTGFQLERVRLHGSAIHLHIQASKLYAATDLGDHDVWDLSVIEQDYCTLLNKIWDEVPVVWEGSAAKAAPPPADHACSLQR